MRMQTIWQIWVMAQALLVPTAAWAAHPLFTDDTGTQGLGTSQLEVNGQFDHDDEGAVETRAGQMAATFSYGLRESIDLVAAIPYNWNRRQEGGDSVSSETGFADTVLDAKWRFFQQNGLSLALKPGLLLATGEEDKGFGAGRMGYHLYAITSREGEDWAMHANLGYIRNENRAGQRENLWHASLAGVYTLVKDLKVVGNIGLDRSTEPDSDSHPAYVLGGLVYAVSQRLDLDCGYRHALTSAGPDWSLLAGVTFHY